MKHELEFKGADPGHRIQSLIESWISRLDRHSEGFSGDPVSLRCLVEEAPAHELFRASVTLKVPKKMLSAKDESHNAETAIHSAFQEVERQLEAYKSGLRGEHGWKRVECRRRLKCRKAGAAATAASPDPEWFFVLVEPHLAKLREVVGHVLGHVKARGDLAPSELEPDDVVDAALARAYGEFSNERTPEDVRSRLVRFALDEIKAAVKRAKIDRSVTYLEERVPRTPPTEQVSTLGDEILDFYQPDEDLKMEDIVPDLEVPPPDQITEGKNLQRCVRDALNGLSHDARRALTLRYIVGLPDKELAKSLRRPEAEVQRLIEDARLYVRAELNASGCAFKPSGSVALRR
jgi:DNA-directed RNA polymerase specialized sigma24 family protein/ribosome-associated translation inhibitor RaiA